jgi:NAD(P)-dependent dehydrogenase (short-subunit alcohol dehydrogenase family)
VRCPETALGNPLVIDPFHAGAVLSEHNCRLLLRKHVGKEVAFSRSLLAPATRTQILVRMLLNLKRIYVHMRSFPQARDVTELLLAINPSALNELRDRRVVNMASLAGKDGTPLMSAYAAAKAGVMAFTKSFGKELADTNIRVNSVAPAAIETDILRQLSPEAVRRMIEISPMKRLGTVEEVSDVVLFLCSEACSFNTGASFDVSGGRAVY